MTMTATMFSSDHHNHQSVSQPRPVALAPLRQRDTRRSPQPGAMPLCPMRSTNHGCASTYAQPPQSTRLDCLNVVPIVSTQEKRECAVSSLSSLPLRSYSCACVYARVRMCVRARVRVGSSLSMLVSPSFLLWKRPTCSHLFPFPLGVWCWGICALGSPACRSHAPALPFHPPWPPTPFKNLRENH